LKILTGIKAMLEREYVRRIYLEFIWVDIKGKEFEWHLLCNKESLVMEFAFFKMVHELRFFLIWILLMSISYLVVSFRLQLRKCSDSASISSSPPWYSSRQNCPLPW
jgi:hypothetical protein